jgi:hypothetical protein
MRQTQWIVACCLFSGIASCNHSEADVQAAAESPPAKTTTVAESASSPPNENTLMDEPEGTNDAPLNAESPALAIFEERILPIFQAKNPSSCAECHLSGVDLKDYIRPTQEQTFASLVDAGLVDVDSPDDSKLLTFIKRRPDHPVLVGEEVRKQEYEAFRSWIQAAVNDPDLLAAKSVSESIGPTVPEAVIRHARSDRVLQSFIDNVWSEVGRCAWCHSPDRNQDKVKEHGEQVSWITLNDPAATMQYMLDAGLIDPDDPEMSLLLMKPLARIKHGGGQKMVVGDRTYKQFRRFIDDYASTVHGRYQAAEDLPAPNDEVSLVSEIWLKFTDVPAEYDKLLMQVDLYPWTPSGWSDFRVATSDRIVFGDGNLWQHTLSLTAPRGSAWADEMQAKRMPPGRYLAKLYVDRTRKLEKDFRLALGEQDLVGEVEFESQWPEGYGEMTVVPFLAK